MDDQLKAVMAGKCPVCGSAKQQKAYRPEQHDWGILVRALCGTCGAKWNEEYSTLTHVEVCYD